MIMQQGEASKLKLSVRDVKSSMKVDEPFIMGFFDNLNDPKVRIYMDAGVFEGFMLISCISACIPKM